MRVIPVAALLLGALLSSAVYADGWICKTDQTVGFEYQGKRKGWQNKIANQRPDETFVVRRSTTERGGEWEVVSLGKDLPTAYCFDTPPGIYDSPKTLHCAGFVAFLMDKDNLRFTAVDSLFYLGQIEKITGDTLLGATLSIGVCSAL